jgi:Holliday junction resolvasome RuvABC endonuclease subunit
MVGQTTRQIKPEVTVAGIDSSLRNTGICVFNQGRPETSSVKPKKLRGAQRLLHIREETLKFVQAHGRPTLVAMEGYSYGSTGRWFDLGEAGGVIKVELLVHGVPAIIVPPASLKFFATSNGGAPKDWMIREAEKQLGIVTKDDNLADAALLALFAYVVVTKDSTKRCELEAIHNLQKENDQKNKLVFKKFWIAI